MCQPVLGTRQSRKKIGLAAHVWLGTQCTKLLWDTFGQNTLKDVITEHITQEIGLDEWNEDDDYEQLDFEFNITDLGDARDGDSVFGDPNDGISTIGDKSTTSLRTTQSTREALQASQNNIIEQEKVIQQKNQEIEAKLARENRLKKIFMEQLKKGLISQAEFDAEFGESFDDTAPDSQPEEAEKTIPKVASRSTQSEGPAVDG